MKGNIVNLSTLKRYFLAIARSGTVPAIFAIGISVAGLSGCGVIPRVQNYRLTAAVEADGKIYTGTTVQQLRCRDGVTMAWAMDVGGCKILGEAVVVPIEGKGVLFIMMGAASKYPVDGKIYLGSGEQMLADIGLVDEPGRSRNHGEWQVENNKLPYMVFFKDVQDPSCITAVDPSDMEAVMGSGVKIKSLKVKTTSSKISYGVVRSYLNWLPNDQSYLLNGKSTATYEDMSLLGLIQTSSLESK